MKYFFFTVLILAGLAVDAQVKISGKITDNKNKTLRGVSITIIDSYDGTTTDSLGNYSFITTEKGPHELEATMSGYGTYRNKIVIDKVDIAQNISVKELITELNAVTITAGSFEASDKKK